MMSPGWRIFIDFNGKFFSEALFPIRVDNLQQGAAFHFTKYPAFFEGSVPHTGR